MTRHKAHPRAEQAHSVFSFITGLMLFIMFMLAMICGNNKAEATPDWYLKSHHHTYAPLPALKPVKYADLSTFYSDAQPTKKKPNIWAVVNN